MLNPLPGITHQDNHQQLFFDVLFGMDKGVLPFTMRGIACIHDNVCLFRGIYWLQRSGVAEADSNALQAEFERVLPSQCERHRRQTGAAT